MISQSPPVSKIAMLSRRTTPANLVYYVSPLLESAGIAHAFSTRLGGVSAAPFDSLNLGNPSGAVQDGAANIAENYRRLQAAIDAAELPRCWVHQVHGAEVHELRPGRSFASGVYGDALVGDDPARLLCVRVADCVPVLLASDDGRAVAAVHAGWRGIVAGVVAAAVERLRALAPSRRLLAAIGPCIGQEAFEVGPEVSAQFTRILGSRAPLAGKRVDLRAAVRLQLADAGVAGDHIDGTDRCTSRDREEFFSHRRERGVTGRMAAIIAPVLAV